MMKSINENVGKLTQWVCSIIVEAIDENYASNILLLITTSFHMNEEGC
jgi:hypothetical protein